MMAYPYFNKGLRKSLKVLLWKSDQVTFCQKGRPFLNCCLSKYLRWNIRSTVRNIICKRSQNISANWSKMQFINYKQMCFSIPRCLWMSTDAIFGTDLHLHTHARSLSLSLCLFALFHLLSVSYKNPSPRLFDIIEIQDFTVFGCSHFIGSTNTKLYQIPDSADSGRWSSTAPRFPRCEPRCCCRTWFGGFGDRRLRHFGAEIKKSDFPVIHHVLLHISSKALRIQMYVTDMLIWT